ncbi:MAG: hypothetical protein ACLFSI_02635 [Halorhodospira sp.]
MKVIEPIEVDESVLLSSTAKSDDTSSYDPDKTYAKGEVVQLDERRYESLVDENDDDPPESTLAEVGPEEATWLDLGATNKWAPFDGVIASESVGDGDLVLEIDPPSAITAVACFNLSGADLEVEIQEGSDDDGWTSVWERQERLIDNTDVHDAWTYAYLPIERKSDVVFTDLPTLITGAKIVIRVKTSEGDARAGQIVLGRQVELGAAVYGTQASIDDWSVVERDEYGNATLRRRRYSNRVRFEVSLETGHVQRVRRRLAQYRATPVVYIGAESNPETIIYGFYRDFAITLSNSALSQADIEVEGLT